MAAPVSTVLLVVLSVASIASAYRDCFQCDSAGDYKSAKACEKKQPDGHRMNAIRMPDEDECFLCFKTVNEDTDQVVRGCIDKDTWKDNYKSEFSKKDQCKDIGDTEVCLCESNLCNGASAVITSLACLVLSLCYRVLV